MSVFSKILLRTKITSDVIASDLINREIVFSNIEKAICVKDMEGNVIKFGSINDGGDSDITVWSAEKIIAEISGYGSIIKYIFGENPIGAIDGSNKIFSTAFDFVETSVEIFLNGLRLNEGLLGDYILDGNSIFIMNYAPIPGDDLTINYFKRHGA